MGFLHILVYVTTCCLIIEQRNVHAQRFRQRIEAAEDETLQTSNVKPEQIKINQRFLDQPDARTISWNPWASPNECSVKCGKQGFAERLRTCSSGVQADCELLGGRNWEVILCDNGPCVQAPYYLPWSSWSTCSMTCGLGVHAKFRNCSTHIEKDCTGPTYELEACSIIDCPIVTTQAPTTVPTTTKVVGTWSEWHSDITCSVSCGAGFGKRTRTCSSGNNNDCAGNYWAVTTCNAGDCTVDGQWINWQAWSTCSETCGFGEQYRARVCVYPDPAHQGNKCPGDMVEVKLCNSTKCVVDGIWTAWGSYTPCSATCDDGVQARTRSCFFPSDAPRGNDCVGNSVDTKTCNAGQCTADGLWAPWSSWSDCTKTCNTGQKFRARVCVYDESRPHGKPCAGDMIGKEACNTNKCAVDGVYSDWLPWAQCSHTCNGGTQSRIRICNFDPTAPRGSDCVGSTSENRDCGLTECAVDGIWGAWGAWVQCSSTCGGGSTARTRSCGYRSLTAPHGRPCDGDGQQTKTCSDNLCPVDATWGQWSGYSSCSVTCGGGSLARVRSCTYDPVAPLGRNCTGSAQEAKQCNTETCPVDGTLTSWSPWSVCSVSCAQGIHHRSRQCFFPLNVRHGDDCHGKLKEETVCNDGPCPTEPPTTTPEPTVPGHWSSWTAWMDCSVTCGGGKKMKTRVCTYPDHSLHGQYCIGTNNHTRKCNTENCPVDGQWSNWSFYSRCSVTCGNGTHTRNRTCDYDLRSPHGLPCNGSVTDSGTCFSGQCPIDGIWGSWEAWATCGVTCGGGTQDRNRVCTYPPGSPSSGPQLKPCTGGSSYEQQSCGTGLCPVDGKLGTWSNWTECSVTCGGGTQTKDRTCDFPDGIPHGNNCTSRLHASRPCNDNLCPVDGSWTEWKDWGACTQTCGGGRQTRKRKCHFDKVAPHGDSCSGAGNERRSCLNVTNCPVDGFWSGWTHWTDCSVSCENGTRSRGRTCTFVDTAPHGNDCIGSGNATEPCNDGQCPVDGVLSTWSTWSSCTLTCGNGTRSRDRTCDFKSGVPPGSNCTGPLDDAENCNTDLCPIDGQFGVWAAWGACTVTCGGGSQSRQRDCDFDLVAPPGNNCTGNYSDTVACKTEPCPVDGVWTAWSNYTPCTTTCGTGSQFRTRQCQYPADTPRGDNCTGSNSEQQDCNPKLCPVDGKFSDWEPWTTCSKSCNNGTQSRNRTCEYADPAPHGDPCTGSTNEDRICHPDPCPIDGHWSEWSTYSTCSLSCGNGTHTRARSCIFHDPAPHGAKCFGATNQTEECNTTACPVDGVWSTWESWNSCSVTCGKGKQVRGRVCNYTPGVPQGLPCAGDMSEAKTCTLNDCPVDGQLSAWSEWTPCSVTCGDGVQFKARTCDFQSGKPKGENCTGALSEQQNCSSKVCPVDGKWSTWETWSPCPVSCAGGTRTRNRTCEYPASTPHGHPCVGEALQNDTCNTKQCPVDGTWGTWSEFSPCTKSCGNGTSTRTRVCEYSPAGAPHGTACLGNEQEVAFCNTTECPQDAVWSVWTTWGACSITCGNGTQTRDRTCSWPSVVHGDNCTGDSRESMQCGSPCAVDGKWNEWSTYTACTTTCNLGTHSRNRTCMYDPVAPRGSVCVGADLQNSICIQGPCPVDKEWSQWASWSTCSTTCGSGVIERTRLCSSPVPTAPVGNANCTGDAREELPCNKTECPVDGNWGVWMAWSTCTATCGHADKSRARVCEYDDTKPRGSDCFGQANETEPCHLPDCAVDGVWQVWQSWGACSVSCGDGTRDRTRVCYFPPGSTHGLNCTGPTGAAEACTAPQECPVDGSWTTWKSWGSCNATCGGGTRIRRRTCSYPPHVPQGAYCSGSGSERGSCNTDSCSVDGVWKDWSAWGACSVTCGDGTQTRQRTCYFPPGVTHGADCSGLTDGTQSCTAPNECPVDGSWTAWKSWGSCNATCGGGTRIRRRTCSYPPHVPQGSYCSGSGSERGSCNTDSCPTPPTTTTTLATTTPPPTTTTPATTTPPPTTTTPATSPPTTTTPATTTPPPTTTTTPPPTTTTPETTTALPTTPTTTPTTTTSTTAMPTTTTPTTAVPTTTTPTTTTPTTAMPTTTTPTTAMPTITTPTTITPTTAMPTTTTPTTAMPTTTTPTTTTPTTAMPTTTTPTTAMPTTTTPTTVMPTTTTPTTAMPTTTTPTTVMPTTTTPTTAMPTTTTPTTAMPTTTMPTTAMHTTTTPTTAMPTTTTPTTAMPTPTTPTTAMPTTTTPTTAMPTTTTPTTAMPTTTTPTTAMPTTTTPTTVMPTTTTPTTAIPTTTTPTTAMPTTTTPIATTTTTRPTTTTTTPTTAMPTTTTTTPTTAMPTTTTPTTTTPIATTTTPTTTTAPVSLRSCQVCTNPAVCAAVFTSQECPADKQYCINELTVQPTGRKIVNRRCGTERECIDGWYDNYSDSDLCNEFQEENFYTGISFYCEYCCDSDNCNSRINMPDKYGE